MQKQKSALKRLQLKLVEVIRELEQSEEPLPVPIRLETTHHDYKLDFNERRGVFRLIINNDEEEA